MRMTKQNIMSYRHLTILYRRKDKGRIDKDIFCFKLETERGCEDLFGFLHMVKEHKYEILGLSYEAGKEDDK